MAYEKQTWVNGDVITAEKLNHIEEGIAEGGGCGYECTETTEQLFSETVTTVESEHGCSAGLAYSEPITADELTVIFNGTQYICPKIEGEHAVYYGGFDPNTGMPDFTNYPFGIVSGQGVDFIVTESPMTATITASVVSTTVETTECFEKAVCESAFYVVEAYPDPAQEMVLTKTWQEIYDAAKTKVVLLRRSEGLQIFFDYLTHLVGTSGSYSLTFGNYNEYTAGSKDDYPVKGGK